MSIIAAGAARGVAAFVLATTVLATLLASGAVAAEVAIPAYPESAVLDPAWQKVDTANSSAGFVVRVAWVRSLPGSFDHVEGVIVRQPKKRTLSVDVRLAAQSLSMPNPEHAAWAQSEEFFDGLRNPWIRFNAEDVPEALLIEGGALTGDLTLRGITREVTLNVTPAACAKPGIDCPVIAEGELQRSEFGMQARRFVVADKVRLSLSIRVHGALSPP